ncbi:MAG: hypothetical protein L3J67_07730 [Hyphomicrobiaceae bacterium]|nr:hypothetical protein [Hyphomicrobiaceae bacterium]
MIDKFLQFTDEHAALAVLATHNISPIIVDENENDIIQRVHSGSDDRGHWLIEVGISVLQTPGTYDADGNEITPAVMVPGYHVNVRLTGFDIDFGGAKTAPTTPQRTFS